MDLSNWALPQLSRLLPLDEESLKQIISHTATLPRTEAAENLQGLLGDTPQALEFITAFNNRRTPPQPLASQSTQPGASRTDISEVPKPKAKKKKTSGLNKLPPPRVPENYGNTSGAYVKKDEEDYVASHAKVRKPNNAFALQEKPDAVQLPMTRPNAAPTPRLPPSAAGALIGDLKPPRNSSRTTSPAPGKQQQKAKVNITGGHSMHGDSSTIADLDSAIRALEISTNPTLASSQDNVPKRRCNCMATRHPLLAAAPNCLNCGKIICVKEGLGPCTFCNQPLLSSEETHAMLRMLREDLGKEKMAAHNAGQKRAEVARAPRPFATPPSVTPLSSAPASDSESEKLAKAKEHRDRLLGFQAQNARRTRVHDEAADFETPDSGTSVWASPQERALQLKKQQKVLREQEWHARPEYEKRRAVVSIDLVGGKIVKRMAKMDRPQTPESEAEDEDEGVAEPVVSGGKGGAFRQNPLLGSLIRPVARVDAKGKGVEREKKQTWRRVQDDNNDNEQWILDGGVYGGRSEDLQLRDGGG
ncbi:C2HC5 finger protein, partial [Mytilinidion resinicola]